MGPRDRRSPGNFYPRPPRGGRHTAAFSMTTMSRFLSTPSARRATKLPKLSSDWIKISIHALREEGDCIFFGFGQIDVISIHALREEGDRSPGRKLQSPVYFYPRPPRGGRPKLYVMYQTARQFLSTPSARRATIAVQHLLERDAHFYPRPPRGGRLRMHPSRGPRKDFYPRPPRGGRPDFLNALVVVGLISIHALREEGDKSPFAALRHLVISIHALREEGDDAVIDEDAERLTFLSTPSARRATISGQDKALGLKFLSTPSARRATREARDDLLAGDISIHALREEGDSKNRDKISIFKQIIQHSARI